jgi:hypothetical protein
MAFLPLAFYLLETRRFRLLAGCLGILFLTHLQLSAVFIPLLFIYGLVRHISVGRIFSSLFQGLLLSAWFWIPAVFLLSATWFTQTLQFNPDLHRPTLIQLLYSPWGFGFSHPGKIDGMSFQLGLAGWVVILISLISYFRLSSSARFFLVISIFAIGLITTPGIWQWLALQSFQFPWRLLAVPLFTLPALLALVPTRRMVLILIFVLAVYSNRNHLRTNLPQSEFNYTRTDTTATATPNEFMPRDLSPNPQSEFLSHWSVTGSAIVSAAAIFWFLLHIRLPHVPKILRPLHT